MDSKIIFIAGIHGVGKTTLCKKISSQILLKHYSAGSLIAKMNSKELTNDKSVKNIENNQYSLIEAINEYLVNDEYYILDGHFCLIDKEKNIGRIPIDTFIKIPMAEIIVLKDSPENICEKIKDRDFKTYNLNFISEFQKQEVEYAKYIARELGIKCMVFDISDEECIVKYVNNIII